MPRTQIFDNETQFASRQLRGMCEKLKLKQVFTSIEHPQTNGQAKATRVLLSYHTTPQSITRETPFSLVYGIDPLMLIETIEPTFRDGARLKDKAVKCQIEMKHRSKVLPRQFKESDLVMRRSQTNTMDNKFSPKWSVLYRIKEVIENRAY